MPVLQSVQQRKLTSVLINHKNCQLFRTLLALSFIHFLRRPVFVWQKSCLLTALYPQFLLQWCLSMFSLVSPSYQPFLVPTLGFQLFSPLFFLATFISKRRGKFFRLFLLSFSDFSIANFKQCWVISPYYSRFPSFQNSHHPSFPLPSPKPLPVLPPPLFSRALVPGLRPLHSSFIFAPLYRKCLVIPFLLRRFI